MSTTINIYKNLYLNSNKSSKKTIFSKSTSNNSYNTKNSHFNLFKNISLIKPKSYLLQKKQIIKKAFAKNEYEYNNNINNNSNNKNHTNTKHNNNNHNKNIFHKLKFFSMAPTKLKNKNPKINYKRNFLVCSPCFKNNTIRKKLIMRNTSTSKSPTLSKKTFIQKEKKSKKIKNENQQILQSFKRENNTLKNLIEKQKVELEKIQKKNKMYTQKLTTLEKEKKMLNSQITDYSNNQDQLILLIKIVQACGVDIDQLIDEYNNNIGGNENKINNESNINNNDNNINNMNDNDEEEIYFDTDYKNLSCNESVISKVDIKTEGNSFIPLILEKEHKKKISKINIPRLNFENILNKNLYNINYNKKQK